jgi:transcriptional regulator with XRE-family HTH domain
LPDPRPLAILVERHRLASDLQRLRQGARISGYELARQLGISQSKVSKIEHAHAAASVAEVETWARACGASAEQVARLAERAERALSEAVNWRGAMREGLPRLQEEVASLEAVSGIVRSYHPVLVPGLLQTAEYARRIYEAGQREERPDIAAAVAARIERQAVLYDQVHRFEFAVPEVALRWRIAPAQVYLAQIDRIISIATLPNIEVFILPLSAEVPVWHSHGFTLFEERLDGGDALVHVETLTAGVNVSDAADLDEYQRVFADLKQVAVSNEEAISQLTAIMAELRST